MLRIQTPSGEIIATPEQDADIERKIDMGQVNPIQATRQVVRGGTIIPDGTDKDIVASEMVGYVGPEEPNHEKRVENLQKMTNSVLERGPLLSQLNEATEQEDASRLRRALEVNQRSIDRSMTRACSACILKNICETTKDGYEGMRKVHPRIKASRYPEADNSTEPLVDMVARIEPNPTALCDPKVSKTISIEAEEVEPVIVIDDSGEAVLGLSIFDDEGDRAEANLQLRNLHLGKAHIALGKRNSANRKAKISIPEKSGRLAEESNDHFEVFASELNQACTLCSHQGDCALASDPVAWDEAKHYANSPSKEWENTIDENGVKHEPRKKWKKRLDDDPNSPCVPPIEKAIKPTPKLPKAA